MINPMRERWPLGQGQQASGSNSMQTKRGYQLLDLLGQKMQAKVRLDESGDRSITGKLGDIVEGTLKGVRGYYVSLMYAGARKLQAVLKSFRCAQVTQRGDSEAVIFLSHANAMSQAEDLRVAINARKRPALSFDQRQRKAMTIELARPNPDHLGGLRRRNDHKRQGIQRVRLRLCEAGDLAECGNLILLRDSHFQPRNGRVVADQIRLFS